MDCRPVDHLWDPSTEPLLLPCTPTWEPCDGIDNDNDGFIDPHCPTIPCDFDAECTYGGLLPDADCNIRLQEVANVEYPVGVCNQIDSVPSGLSQNFCWGRLCPPSQKCVQGECIEPGKGLPGSICTSGADCPLNSGCIPSNDGPNGQRTIGTCYVFCHDLPCPQGFVCMQRPNFHVPTDSSHMSHLCQQECPEDCATNCDILTGECLEDQEK
ncbi:MAG TPA: hypothetical protein EYN66_22315 [Myxococcales bacterium]|nr:hypothetical protein [Myxococcales bacterium]